MAYPGAYLGAGAARFDSTEILVGRFQAARAEVDVAARGGPGGDGDRRVRARVRACARHRARARRSAGDRAAACGRRRHVTTAPVDRGAGPAAGAARTRSRTDAGAD